jgi:hypothetical protein
MLPTDPNWLVGMVWRSHDRGLFLTEGLSPR